MLVTLVEYRDKLIAEGHASVDAHEKRAVRRQGSHDGFDSCRTLASVEAFDSVLRERLQWESRMAHTVDDDVYWRHRYATLQIQFVRDRLVAFETLTGQRAWTANGLSARAALSVAETHLTERPEGFDLASNPGALPFGL